MALAAEVMPRPSVGDAGLIRLSALASLACVAAALLNQVLVTAETSGSGPTGLETILVSLALLCIVGLTIDRAPSVALVCAAVAAGLAAIDLIGLDRATPDVRSEAFHLVIASLVRAAPACIATAYAVRRRRTRPPALVVAVAIGGILATLAANVIALAMGWGQPAPFDGEASRFANRAVLTDVAVALGIGGWLDLWPGWIRARERWRLRPGLRPPERAAILVEELAPMLAARRRATAQAERARLAADLHATLLPPLRSALAASRSGSVEATARGLDEAVGEVERLMASREPVIVDALGLLPGLEWLAERIQLREGIPVEIDIEVTGGRPWNDVERAAFHVAQLALDNVVRHSRASGVTIRGVIASDAVELRIDDDGVGLGTPRSDAEDGGDAAEARSIEEPRRVPGRGLSDMRARTMEVGAELRVGDRAGGGTSVQFEWHRR